MTALVATGTLAAADSSVPATVAFLLAWAVSTMLPGVLVWRALTVSGTVAQDTGFGAGIGIGIALVAWFVSTAIGVPLAAWVIPVAGVAILAAFRAPRERMLARRRPGSRSDWRSHLATSGVATVALLLLYVLHLRLQPLPPRASATYPDLWYHVTLVNELATSVVPQDPSVLGEPVVYHWFAHAHMALLSAMSGVPGFEVVLHLWFVPMTLTMVLVSVAVVERLQGRSLRWWVAPLGVLAAIVIPSAWFGNSAIAWEGIFTVNSPTNILAAVVILTGAGVVREVTESPGRWQGWALLVVVCGVAAGSKPSALPVLAAAGALVAVLRTIQSRRLSWPGVGLTLVPLGGLAIASTVLFGSTGASRVQLFQTLALSPAVQSLVGPDVRYWEPGSGGAVAPFLDGAWGGLWVVSATVLIGSAVANMTRLAGLFGAADSGLREDPTWVWAAGAVAAGFTAQWMLSHPGYSQLYFWFGVIPLGAALSCATAARLTPPGPARPGWALLALSGLAVGTGTVLLQDSGFSGSWASVVLKVAVPYLVGAVVLVAVVVLLRRGADRLPPVRWTGAAVVFGVAVSLPFGITTVLPPVRDAVTGTPAPVSASEWTFVSSDAQAAAIWLSENSSPTDVVATNVLCQPVPYAEQCSRRSFWVAALSDRQLLLGGWEYATDYIDLSLSADDERLRAGPWPERVDLSLAVVESGSPAAADELVDRYGVRWIFADRDASPVSDALDDIAERRFENDEIVIYRLDG